MTAFALGGVAVSTWGPRLPELRSDLGLGIAAIGLVLPGVTVGSVAGLGASSASLSWLGSRRGICATLWLIGPAIAIIGVGAGVAHSVAVTTGLRINNVIPPDGYDRFSDEWEDPDRSKGNFWSYIDARDVGTAYRAALEGTSSGHEVCLIAAADTRKRDRAS